MRGANGRGINATRDFIGWVVLFRPRRPIFGGLSRTSTARRLVLHLSSPTSRAHITRKAHGPEKTTTQRWGSESTRRVTAAEDAPEGGAEWGRGLEERGGEGGVVIEGGGGYG